MPTTSMMEMESTADAQMMQDVLPNSATATNSEAVYQGSDAAAAAAAAAAHRRGYQACDPCRKRKVKCDLGSVDNPRPPPCVRCRRESKRCEFSATRRKRKASDATDHEPDGPLRRDRRMMIGEVSYSESPSIGSNGNNNESPYAPPSSASYEASGGGITKPQWPETSPSSSVHRSASVAQKEHYQPSAQPATHFRDAKNVQPSGTYSMPSRASAGIESRQHVMNKTAADLLFPTISNTHDALHLLSEAAGRTEDLNRQNLENQARQSGASYGGQIPTGPGVFSRNARHSYPKTEHSTAAEGYANTHGSDYRKHGVSPTQDPGYLDAVKAWSRLRFVRAGWLTVEEAMAYVAYYYKHLAPLSPIVIPDFSPPSTHRALLTDEPVLAVAMLTTASRHMKPKGDGSHTRGYYIHDRLWAYLRGMIERLFWGQEKFAGNSVGMSTPRSLDIGPPPASASLRGNLRSLGTVEALLILTDWHPRNLHFPPGDDENTLLDTDALLQTRGDGDGEGRNQPGGGLEGRLAFQKWLEPTWRSDRMSWMLLSTAQALAFELGVFDLKDLSGQESVEEQMRKRRVRRLIIVYITQSSGRLGIPSMLPLDKWSGDIEPLSPQDASDVDLSTDRMQDLWVQISRIMSLSNSDLFPSKEKSSELIQTGRYKERIAEFIPRLQAFKANMESVPLSPQMRNILAIEYEYTRVYVNCLALQAVVERWTAINNEPSNKSSASGSLRVLMELYRVNEKYIQEVVDASRRILSIVLEGLVPGDHLKHCPVRTFFRVLSGMIFILKTFTLGATEDDVRVSLALQDRTIEALRTCVVDDVHLSNTISRLLELLTTNIRTRFLRFAPTDRGVDGEGNERNSQPDSRLSSPRPTKDNPQIRREAHHQWPHPQNTGHNVNYHVDHTNQPVTSYHDPLANIPAQPINSSNIGVSFMPPPPSVYHSYYDPNDTPPKLDEPASMVHEGGLPDWFALPLDQFFNNSTGAVDQGLGGTGPMLGEFDMLEVLLNEGYDKDGHAGGSAGSGGAADGADPMPSNDHPSFI